MWSQSERFVDSYFRKGAGFVGVSQDESEFVVGPHHVNGLGREPDQTRAAHGKLDFQMFGIDPGVGTWRVADLHIAVAHEGHLLAATSADLVPAADDGRAGGPARQEECGDASGSKEKNDDNGFPLQRGREV